MPRKIRELKADLRRAGCTMQPGKGSHTGWRHPLTRGKLTLSGKDGDDAQDYQEAQIRVFLEQIRQAQEEQ
jgi:predicted RNA binding protein YcfA (HicA-like mRNA interferase family)